MREINIYDVLFWIFFIIAVITVFWYLFGNSPTLEESMLVLILTFVIIGISQIKVNNYRLNMMEKKFNRFENSFIKLVDDFREIKVIKEQKDGGK